MNEMIQFAYAPDIVMDTVKKMQEWIRMGTSR